MKHVCMFLCVLALVACGGSQDYEQRQKYIDTCIIEAGPQAERNNIINYCEAKWRQSQRDAQSHLKR